MTVKFLFSDLLLQLADLDQRVCNKMCRGRAINTHRNVNSHLKIYRQFCDRFKPTPFPAAAWEFCQFAVFLSDFAKLKPGTISNYIGSIMTLYKIGGYQYPPSNDIWFDLTFKGIRKDNIQPVKQADAITPYIFKFFKFFQFVI